MPSFVGWDRKRARGAREVGGETSAGRVSAAGDLQIDLWGLPPVLARGSRPLWTLCEQIALHGPVAHLHVGGQQLVLLERAFHHLGQAIEELVVVDRRVNRIMRRVKRLAGAGAVLPGLGLHRLGDGWAVPIVARGGARLASDKRE